MDITMTYNFEEKNSSIAVKWLRSSQEQEMIDI